MANDLSVAKRTKPIALGAAALCMASVSILWAVTAPASERAVSVPPPALDQAATAQGLQQAVFAGGCFWGVQGVFQHVHGVKSAVSGYAGGERDTAHYEQVGSGRTGHAESVSVTYDPREISYGRLLRIFFSVAHDPTQLDRQGPDSGPQYRSAVFPQNEEQKRIAASYIAQLDKAGIFSERIVTKTDAAPAFFPAEAYHQNYLTLHPNSPYIAINDMPKVENLKRLFPDEYQADPVLVATRGGS